MTRQGRPTHPIYALGIDGGGTQTRAVLIDRDGNEHARARGGPSNYHTVGLPATEASLREAIAGALGQAGIEIDQVDCIGLGMAGVDRPDDLAAVRALIERIGRFRRVVLTHDAEAALVGGTGRRYGAVLIAGTGAIAYGVNTQGDARRADGWGPRLGDDGSAYWIGRAGLRAVARALDARGPATALQAHLFEGLGLHDAQELVPRVYSSDFGPAQIAALAPLVCAAARANDAVAERIVHEAGQRLAATLGAVITGLGMGGEAFDAALAGGLLQGGDVVREAVIANLGEIAPRARPIAPRHDAAYGAAQLAWEDKGEVDERR
jgi:N-acetylglucosamine kinase-like BadF-type ATPase